MRKSSLTVAVLVTLHASRALGQTSAPSGDAPASQGATNNTAANNTAATTQMGRVDIATSDHQGTIELDGNVVGSNGGYQGDVSSGSHHLKVTREGYEPYEKHFTVEIGQIYSEAVSLRLSGSSQGEGSEQGNARPFGGIYGGLGVGSLFMPGGAGTTFDRKCDSLGATCETSSPIGASFFAYGGYSFNPVSFELFVLGSYDVSSPSASFPGGPPWPPGSNEDLAGPKRQEDFTIHRVGGVAAARVRYTVDGPVVRVHGAAGVGVAFRSMILTRDSQTTDGTGLVGKFAPPAVGYVSPALNFDLGVHFRASGFLGLTLGLMATLESANIEGGTASEDKTRLANPADPSLPSKAQPTPRYDPARAVQFFLGPYLGLEFGP